MEPSQSPVDRTRYQGPAHEVLADLDRTLYRLQRRKNWEGHSDNNLLLLSYILRLMGMAGHRLYPHPGSFRDLLEHNDIYNRTVALPKDFNSSEYQLLILFDAADDRPYLLRRNHRLNQVLTVEQGQVVPLTQGLPTLQDRAIELYPLMPPTLSQPLDVLRFTYSPEIFALIALGAISLVVVAFSLSIPILTNTLVSRVLPETDYGLLLESLVVVSLIITASVTSQYIQGIMTLRLETISDLRLQTALWDRLTKLPLLFIRSYSIGDLNSRVSAIYRIRNLINADSLTSLLAALFSLTFFVLMFTYQPQLALWAAGLVIVIYGSIFWLARSAVAIQDTINPIMATISNFAFHSVTGVAQIRTLGSEVFILNRWMSLFTQFANANLRSNALDQLIDLLTDLLGTAGSLLMFTVVIIQVLAFPANFSSPSSLANFIAFYAAFIAFCAAVSSATTSLADVFANVASLWKRCEPVIYEPVESGYSPSAIHHEVEGNFSISSLSFHFPGSSQKTFDNISFEIKAGSYSAITGPSGAGKSTLLKLITGLVPPTSGEILVDNVPLRMLAIRAYRRQLGIVIQDARLDNGTILEVVRGGRTDSEAAVWQALEMACVADEVHRMPLGLQTQILNGGSNISGGQRQRLALARALLPQPRVLLLDEATSAIDNISQQAISDTIDNLGITRIAIAHRLSTLRHADQVLVIENGTISQRGSFDELLQQEGYLQRMVALESRRSA
jgi:ATP-binding cassette subfamily B protein